MNSHASVRETIGRRIRALRRGKGHSQENLAEQTCLSANYISRIENGDRLPSIDVLCNIAEALGIETFELLVKETTTENFGYKKKQLIKILNESKPTEISLYLEVITALHKNSHKR